MVTASSASLGHIVTLARAWQRVKTAGTAVLRRASAMDLKNPKWMYLKAALLLAIGVVSLALVWLENPKWTTALYLALMVWAFARAYYFAFYVIEKYVDDSYRFAGLWSFVRYVWGRRGREDQDSHGP